MTKWEYLETFYDSSHSRIRIVGIGKIDVDLVRQRYPEIKLKVKERDEEIEFHGSRLEELLDMLGTEGWELICYLPGMLGRPPSFLFKRIVQNNAVSSGNKGLC